MFKHKLGALAVSKTMGLKGFITARAENLFGCSRYYIQPKANKDMKIPDGMWIDEDDVNMKGPGLSVKNKPLGGPPSSIK